MEVALETEYITSLDDLQKSCRICLKKGDINIWNHKIKVCEEDTYTDAIELINIFSDTILSPFYVGSAWRI
uniref:Uncharacterized protein n=1 Tax=Musca domestica TaxID=7370 RepID=A0A1I8MAN2_MUSDO